MSKILREFDDRDKDERIRVLEAENEMLRRMLKEVKENHAKVIQTAGRGRTPDSVSQEE